MALVAQPEPERSPNQVCKALGSHPEGWRWSLLPKLLLDTNVSGWGVVSFTVHLLSILSSLWLFFGGFVITLQTVDKTGQETVFEHFYIVKLLLLLVFFCFTLPLPPPQQCYYYYEPLFTSFKMKLSIFLVFRLLR